MEINTAQYFNKLKGYRISKSHFELGSNLHIRDYFYAKRLFYNSFYTNRFAFLISRFILNHFREKITTVMDEAKPGDPSAITLLGYDSYSDLLVSNVRKMLNDHLRSTGAVSDIFNHDICTKETQFLKNPERLNKDVILIFPISTTFSTSLKVQTEIQEKLTVIGLKNKNVNFLNPVINCLVIAPEPLETTKLFSSDSPAYQYGWEQINVTCRVISLMHYDSLNLRRQNPEDASAGDDDKVDQRYFISLHTPWNNIDTCRQCYPDDPSKEICLTETKANSITPNLIFGYPISYANAKEKNIYTAFTGKRKNGNKPVVYRKYIRKNGNNYIYYIRVGRFLQHNKDSVTDWLKNHCMPRQQLEDRNVVIVTPTLGSNSGFVNQVNDVLFSDVATIIQYNPKEEFLQNFKLFYTELLQRADIVIYVDDVLATTRSISELNFFVKHARSGRRSIDFCITLINRAGYFNYLKLQSKLRMPNDPTGFERIFSFIDVHVPPIAHREKYPYMALVDKFRDLSSKSVLDTMRLYFKKREQKFSPVDLSREYEDLKGAGEPPALFQFLMTHEFMKLFCTEADGRYRHAETISQIFEHGEHNSFRLLMEFIERPVVDNSIIEFINAYPEFAGEVGHSLLKICSSEPFIQHGKIKQAAFSWVLAELRSMIFEINSANGVGMDFFEARKDGKAQKYNQYQTLMFLLKRAGKLKINYIYSLEVMQAVNHVIHGILETGNNTYFENVPKDVTNLFEKAFDLRVSRMEEIYPAEFITYYVGLLQELILDHESKALKLVYNIKMIIDQNLQREKHGRSLKNSYNDDFTHLLRLLVLENTFIFYSAADKFLKKNLRVSFGDSSYEPFLKKLELYFPTYPFLYSRHMLSRFTTESGRIVYERDEDIIKSFQYMMVLKAMFDCDMHHSGEEHQVLIERKLKRILELSCKILGIKQGGAFFAMNYMNRESIIQQDDIAIVGEYKTDDEQEMDADSFTSDSFLHQVFQGIQEHNIEKPMSTFEITIDDSGFYHFRKNIALRYDNTYHFSEFQDKLYRNIFYLRITELMTTSDKKNTEVHPQAVLGFYSDPLNQEESDRFILRQEAVIDGGRDTDEASVDEATVYKRDYKRFDPKQVRQLLLLRNDLSEFINHHLNNDSLRAYIEMLNNTKLSTSLKHGIGIYERLFDKYTAKLNNYAAGVNEEVSREIEKGTGYIKVIFSYLTNKMHLISLANDAIAYKDYSAPGFKQIVTLGQVVDEFKHVKAFIFQLEQDNILGLPEERIFFDAGSISAEDLNICFRPFPKLLKELVFEVLYNIKKHAVNDSYSRITVEDPLEIRLFTTQIGQTLYLCVSNNYLIKTPRYIRQLNAKLSRTKGVDGLNLIYNILYKTTGNKLSIDAQNGYFNVNIPIITIKDHENTDC